MARALRLPLQISHGGLATLEQGSDPEIAQSVALLLSSQPGERRSVPGYGLPNPLGGRGAAVEDIVAVISEWEERADPTYVEEVADGIVQQLKATPRSTSSAPIVATAVDLVNGARYSTGLGYDAQADRFYIDPTDPNAQAGLKIVDGQPYADTEAEPTALNVGIEPDGDPYYEET